MSRTISPAEIAVGDVVKLRHSGISYAGVSGSPVRAGRINVFIRSTVRFSPDGPWYEQVHKVPRIHVTSVLRDGRVLPVRGGH